jgi:hypothetical protein
VAAREARLVESARLRREHAAVLAQQAASSPPRPRPAPTVGLTALFATLEDSGLFTPPVHTPPPPPRTRLAKGSVPIPMPHTPARVAPALGPYSTVGTLAPGAHVRTAPPPIPRRAAGSVPPPIPRRPPPRR